MENNLWKIKEIERKSLQFPKKISAINDCPEKIFLIGKLNESPTIGIVGTRKASSVGKEIAYKISRELADKGFCIISGLALGIDAEAHKGALDSGGTTIAVLANGLDTIYPPSHKNLAKKIIEQNGAIISEYPEGTPSYPNQFIQRNRLISALSDAIVVIEAPEQSGAISTAIFAKKQGKKVFVIPGPASSANYVGSFRLMRDFGRLVTSARDILNDLGYNANQEQSSIKFKKLSREQRMICDALENSGEPMSIDKILEKTKLENRKVSIEISKMIFDEIISETNNGKYYISK